MINGITVMLTRYQYVHINVIILKIMINGITVMLTRYQYVHINVFIHISYIIMCKVMACPK